MADSFLGRWLGRVRSAPPSADEARAELDRLATERPAVRAPALWLRELLPDLAADKGVTPPPLTADQAPRERETALALGADLFLTKPFSPLELIQAVERLLGPDAV